MKNERFSRNWRIFVAGHRGLVGSNICAALRAAGYENILTKDRATLDLCDFGAVDDFFAKNAIDAVFLAAAKVGGILANNTFRADFIYQNLAIQNNIIHSAHKHGVKKLLFLGSSCIYPKFAPQPMRESCLLSGALEYTNEPYAIAKIAGLKMCESYALQHGANFISVMPTNLYGENDNFDLQNSHVLPALIRKIHLAKCLECGDLEAVRRDLGDDFEAILERHKIRATSLEVWGSGEVRREFLHARDLARACVFVMERVDFCDLARMAAADFAGDSTAAADSREAGADFRATKTAAGEKTAGAASGEVRNTHINIGQGSDISIRELAFLVKKVVGFGGEIIFDKTKPDGTPQKLLDTTRLRRLGFTPQIDLEAGIKMVYESYQRR